MIEADGTFIDTNPISGGSGFTTSPFTPPPPPVTPTASDSGPGGGTPTSGYPTFGTSIIAPPTGPAIDTTPWIPVLRGGGDTTSAPASPPAPTTQQTTDKAASAPPFDTNAPAVTQVVPTAPDNSAALAALGNLFQSAFSSGTPQAPIISGGGGGSFGTASAGDAGTSADPNANAPATSSGPSVTTWAILILTALGVFFAYKQYKKMKAEKAK